METARVMITMAYQLVALIFLIAGAVWAMNKVWLSSIYFTKKDWKEFMQNYNGTDKSHISKISLLEKEFEVLKVKLESRDEYSKLQFTTLSDMLKQVKDEMHSLCDKILQSKGISPELFNKLSDKVDSLRSNHSNHG